MGESVGWRTDTGRMDGGLLEQLRRTVAQDRDVRRVRHRRNGVENVRGKDARDRVGVGQRGEMLSDREMPGVLIAPRQRVIGARAKQRLYEPVLPAFGRPRIVVDDQNFLAAQAFQHRVEIDIGRRKGTDPCSA